MRFLSPWLKRAIELVVARASAGTCAIEALENRRLLSASGAADVKAEALASSSSPRPDHVVVVVEENHSYGSILGPQLPSFLWPYVLPSVLRQDLFIRSLASHGASFTNAHAQTHPSEPNYLALFSGSTQGVKSDAVPPHPLTAPSLGGQLIANGMSFAGYSESMPRTGFLGATAGEYARKHNPWSDFADVPASANLPFSAFPKDYSQLPDVSFVVPNQRNDMHSGSIRAADRWLQKHLKAYVKWAKQHNSLLVVTWDEGSGDNHIATIFSGASVKPGEYPERVNHYNVLRTIEEMYGVTPLGNAAQATPITDVFK